MKKSRAAQRFELIMVVVAALMLGFGAACGSSDTDSGTEDAATSAPSPAQAPQATAGTVTMTTGRGTEMTLSLLPLDSSREYIYCELVFAYGDVGSDIYSTSPLAPCSIEWWDNLDLDALAQEFAAQAVVKNGPQWWSMDEVRVMGSDPVSVAGAEMVFGAHLPAGTLSTPVYTVFHPAKYQFLRWETGKPSYQLVDPEGHVYVVQGHKIPVEELATLGDRMEQLPEGWEYRVVTLEQELVMDLTPNAPIPSVIDEFDQIYIRIPGS